MILNNATLYATFVLTEQACKKKVLLRANIFVSWRWRNLWHDYV